MHRSVLAWGALIVLALALTGCTGVYTPYPLVREPTAGEADNLPAGLWEFSDGDVTLEAWIGKDGHAKVACLSWNRKRAQFELVATEAFVTPRRSNDEMQSRGFVSIRQLGENGDPIDRYALVEYRVDRDHLLVWQPHSAEFRNAVDDGYLQGAVFAHHVGDSVLVTTPSEKFMEFLEDPANTLSSAYDGGPGGRLFDYTNPTIFKRIATDPEAEKDDREKETDDQGGELEDQETEESLGIAIFGGGIDTLREPNPVAKVTSLEVTEVGQFAVTKESTRPAPGPAGVMIIPREEPVLQVSSTRIPAVRGPTFGARVVIRGTPQDGWTDLTSVWRFPSPGLAEPGRDLPWYEDRETGLCLVGQETFVGYALRYDWELVPGIWTLEIWRGNRRLLVQTFELYRPDSTDAH